jgi:hypothetical protein
MLQEEPDSTCRREYQRADWGFKPRTSVAPTPLPFRCHQPKWISQWVLFRQLITTLMKFLGPVQQMKKLLHSVLTIGPEDYANYVLRIGFGGISVLLQSKCTLYKSCGR